MSEYRNDCQKPTNEQIQPWDAEKGVEFTLTDTKCFKTPTGMQKTATIGVKLENTLEDNLIDDILDNNVDSVQFSQSSNIPSTSIDNHQPIPLRRLSIKIGTKVLKFKVINSDEAPEGPEPFESSWASNPVPVLQPKPLAGLYHCTNCKTYFGNKEVWQMHMMEVHGDPRPYRCFSCGMRFANKNSMTKHLKDHSLFNPNFFSCKSCPKTFANADGRNRHQKMHQIRLTCPNCSRFCRTVEQLSSHLNQCHPQANYSEDLLPNGTTARFTCNFCPKRFHFKRDMVIHERIHTGEKPFTCGYCGRGFAQSQALTIHIRTHTQEFPYKCTSCIKKFRDTSSLRKHEITHHSNIPVRANYRMNSLQN